MAIITISRGTFAGGSRLADALGERLRYRAVSREDLFTRLKEKYGLDVDESSELLEQGPTRAELASSQGQRLSMGRRRRLLFFGLQATLCDLLKEDNVVYHGLTAHLLLPGVTHILRLRLIAPRPMRVEMAMQRDKLTRFEASKKIDLVDNERRRWAKMFFGVEWEDPALFDLVLNLENLSLDDVANVTAYTATLPRFRTTPESLHVMEQLSFSSHLMARVLSDPATTGVDFDLEVNAAAGEVKVLGLLSPADRTKAEDLVRGLPGVKKVTPAISAR